VYVGEIKAKKKNGIVQLRDTIVRTVSRKYQITVRCIADHARIAPKRQD
jgi:hypothetical protein